MNNILVCDDDTSIVDSIEIYLQQEGYQVFKAYDGVQALEVLKKRRYSAGDHRCDDAAFRWNPCNFKNS